MNDQDERVACSVSFTQHATRDVFTSTSRQNVIPCTIFSVTSNVLAASGTSQPTCRAIAFLITVTAALSPTPFPPRVWAPALIYRRWPATVATWAVRATGGIFTTPPQPFMAAWPRVVPTATGPARPSSPSLANAKRWRFGRRKLRNMLSVDERQFELGYTPIACGLLVVAVGCVLTSVIAAIWWFLLRGI